MSTSSECDERLGRQMHPAYLRGVNDDVQVVLPPAMRDAVQRIEQRARSERRWRIANRLRDWVFFSLVISLCVLVMVQIIDRGIPVSIAQTLETPVVHPGDKLRLRVHINERYRACDLNVTYTPMDGAGGFHGSITTGWTPPVFSEDDQSDIVRYIAVSHDSEPGMATLRITRQWRCPYNLVQRQWPITDIVNPIPFRILPPSS